MLQGLAKILDRCCLVLGAFCFSQFPAFFQQYTQRLAGHVAELSHQLRELQHMALQVGKTLPEYIHKFSSHQDLEIAQQGAWMLNMVDRHLRLSDAMAHLSNAEIWARPYVFAKHAQWDIVQGTMADFQPGLHFTLEGLVYVVVGMCVGYSIYAVVRRCVRTVFFTRKEQRT